MAPPEQFTMPVQDGLGADQQQMVPPSVFGEVVQQAGEDGTVAVGEARLADLTPQDQQLLPEYEDLDVLVSVAHRQEAQERQGVGRGEVGQAQQHDRS
ncbi:hypothetical protein ACFV2X_23295 [Streptomyces sp. NPDC059679]|uniref:hypothetical protein n=1 Tax=Streptomyces sp. NPDC059679 TaxID=3346903 RepID=UPI0036918519